MWVSLMECVDAKIINSARPETLPQVPGKVCWKAKFFGRKVMLEYLRDYYERESKRRVPFYLPYLYMREHFTYLRRYAKIPKSQISMVLIDGNDERIDYFLSEFLDELNFLTIVTERKKYFESLQERAFQELGLLIDLASPWEAKNLRGNMVWDFTERIQSSDCYPNGCICYMPHKKEWKIQEQLKSCKNVTAVSVKNVEIGDTCILPALAETLLVPERFPFRKSRLEELRRWCQERKWTVKMKAQVKAQSIEKP